MNEADTKRPGSVALLIVALMLAVLVWAIATRGARPADVDRQVDQAPEPESSAPAAAIEPSPTVTGGNTTTAIVNAHEEPSEAEILRRRNDAMRQVESDYIGEPLDAAWAAAKMALVEQAFSSASVAQYGATPPRSSAVDCHSRTCRIVAVYGDIDEAALGQFAITAAIGKELPGAKTFMVEQPDGSQRLIIYAKAPLAHPKPQ